MKLNLRPVIASAAVLAITGGVLAATVSTAVAVTTPPWEPDPNALGSINFYNSSGTPITGGSSLTHLADYIEASSADTAGGTKATLVFANPTPPATTPTGNFPTGQGSASTAFPNAGAPAPLNTDPKPVVTLGASDGNLANFVASQTANTAAGYANVYQVRLVTSGPGGVGTTADGTYWEDDIVVNTSNNSWSIQYPASVTNTQTTLTAAPNPAVTTDNVTLTATESPATAGSVQFKDGSTNIGSPVAVNGSGIATKSSTFTAGSHSLSAVFTPTDTADFNGSTGNTTLQVNPPATHTTTTLVVSQDGTAGDDVNLSATVKAGSTPVDAGTVSFYDNNTSTPLNSSPVSGTGGVYTFDIPGGLPAGGHSIVAKFTPTDVTQFEASQSAPQSFVLVTAGGACTQPGSSCTDTQYIQATVPVGTLSISTPYDQDHPLDLGTLNLNASAGQYSASAPFSNINVTDTRSGGQGWTASALASPLSDGGSNSGSTINAQNLGLTNLTFTKSAGDTATVATTDNPAANPAVAPTDPGSQGLGGSTPHSFATSTVASGQSGDGNVNLNGTLTLNAPTSTEAGLFKGTITFTVG